MYTTNDATGEVMENPLANPAGKEKEEDAHKYSNMEKQYPPKETPPQRKQSNDA
jgi:hypothetical protein